MSGRLVSLGAAATLLVGLAGALVGACYELPEPACGFVCGPSNACPAHYTCADDHRCHRDDAPDDLVCPGDAAVDAAPDAPP